MKQLIQNLKTGRTILEEIPVPQAGRGMLLIRSTRSLVSLGTEKMLVEFSKANLIQKACKQPDKVKQVLDKMKTEGVIPTLEAVFKRLDEPLALGYCNVGVVVETGSDVFKFKPGDRVVNNGPHAEYVCVPKNLCVKIPDKVSDEEAVFTVLGAIGLQGIRLLHPQLGETVVIVGMGLIGLLSAQLLKANGCRVIGVDIDEHKLGIAASWGLDTVDSNAHDPAKFVTEITEGVGADAVLITASAKTDEILHQAAEMSRKRGRIVLVGVIGLNIRRADFYEKELSFQVSCSYGPGRYDENYEQKGIDYPLPYVRWTEKRNFEAVLQAMAQGQLQVGDLITKRVDLEDYRKIYDRMDGQSIASILVYPTGREKTSAILKLSEASLSETSGTLGIIGAGDFTKMTALPALAAVRAPIKSIASSKGLSGTILAKKYGIAESSTNHRAILDDPEIQAVVITTRHGSHAAMTIEALDSGKHVFVEKPLALTIEDVDSIVRAQQECGKTVTVGYNRRFSPHVLKMKQLLGDNPGEMNIIATMNAGFIPSNSWVHDPDIGGGRILGEACHYLDLLIHLTGQKILSVCMNSIGKEANFLTDNASILLKFEHGANGVVHYFANGSKRYFKERVEVHRQGKTLIMENFRITRGYGYKGFSRLKTKINKGHKEQFKRYVEMLRKGGRPIIPFDQIINGTRAALAALESLRKGNWVNVEGRAGDRGGS